MDRGKSNWKIHINFKKYNGENKKRKLEKNHFLKNSIDFTRPTVPVIMTSPPGAA